MMIMIMIISTGEANDRKIAAAAAEAALDGKKAKEPCLTNKSTNNTKTNS